MECVTSRTSGINHGCDAGPDAADVGINTVVGNSGIDVGVDGDYSGSDHLAFDFYDPFGFFGRDVYRYFGNFAFLNGNISERVQVLRWINHRSAFYYEVIHW